jgi:phage terminase small subunit
MDEPKDPLTAKQRRFVEEYLVDLNATQSAIRAGYSKDSASIMGWENLRKPEIASALAQLQQERSARVRSSADQVVQELEKLATPKQRRPGCYSGSEKLRRLGQTRG